MTKKNEKLSRWVCLECSYIYDPAKGDEEGGIPPGVAFEDLPELWACPDCGARKSKKGMFKKLDD